MRLALPFLLLFGLPTAFFGQIINIEELRLRAKDSTAWHGQLGGSSAFAQNSKKVFQAAADAQIEWKKGRRLVLGIARFRFLSTGGERFLSDGMGHGRLNQKIGRRDWLALEAFGQWQFNRQLLIRRRELLGLGLRARLVKTPFFRAYAGAAAMPERVFFVEETSLKSIRASQYFSWTWQPGPSFLMNSTVYWQPKIGSASVRRWSAEHFLQLKISKKISFRADWSSGFDANLPAAAPRFSQTFSNGLTWSL